MIRVIVGESKLPFYVKDIKEVCIYTDKTYVTLENGKKYVYPSHECDFCGDETNNASSCDDCFKQIKRR